MELLRYVQNDLLELKEHPEIVKLTHSGACFFRESLQDFFEIISQAYLKLMDGHLPGVIFGETVGVGYVGCFDIEKLLSVVLKLKLKQFIEVSQPKIPKEVIFANAYPLFGRVTADVVQNIREIPLALLVFCAVDVRIKYYLVAELLLVQFSIEFSHHLLWILCHIEVGYQKYHFLCITVSHHQ